jgi:hypothetical protein
MLVLKSLTLATIQFSAILGDLSHKQDLYLLTQSFGISTSCHFSNTNQAGYLLTRTVSLIPIGHQWNNHSLGTFFEHFYYSNLSFRLNYLSDFPALSCV